MKKLVLLSLLCTITYNGQVGISMESSLDSLHKESQGISNNIKNIQDENIINNNDKMNKELLKHALTIDTKTMRKLNFNTNNIKIFSRDDIIKYLNSNNALTFSVENILDPSTIDNTIKIDTHLSSFEEWSYNYLSENYTQFILDQYQLIKNDNDFIDSVIEKLKQDKNSVERVSNALSHNDQYARHIIHNNIYAVLKDNSDKIKLIYEIKSSREGKQYDTKNNIRSSIISSIARNINLLPSPIIKDIAAALIKVRRDDTNDYNLTFVVNNSGLPNLSNINELIINGYITNPKTMSYVQVANIRRYLKVFNSELSYALDEYQNNIMDFFASEYNDNSIINNCITFLNNYFHHAGNKSGEENRDEIALIVLRAPKYLIFTRNIIQNKIYNIAVEHYLNIAKDLIQQYKNVYNLSNEQLKYNAIYNATSGIMNEYRRAYVQTILYILLSSEVTAYNDFPETQLNHILKRIFSGEYGQIIHNTNLLLKSIFKSINPTNIDYFDFYEKFNSNDIPKEFENNLQNVDNDIWAKYLIDEGYVTNPYYIQCMKDKYNYQNSELDNQYPGTGSNTIIEGEKNKSEISQKSENSNDNKLVDNSQNNKNIILNNNINNLEMNVNNDDIKENNNLINNINNDKKPANKINEDIINNNILVNNNEIKNNINNGIKREFVNNNKIPGKDNEINNIINNENKISEENNINKIEEKNLNKDSINEIKIEEAESNIGDKLIKNDKESINNIINNNNLNKDTNTSVNNNNNMEDNTIEQNKDLKFENLVKVMRKPNKFNINIVNEFLTKLSKDNKYKKQLRDSMASLKSKDDRSIYRFLTEEVFKGKNISITQNICQAIIAYFELLPQKLEKK